MGTIGMEQGAGTAQPPAAPQASVVPPLPQRPGAPTADAPRIDAPVQGGQGGQGGTEAVIVQQPPYRTIDNQIPPEVIPILGIVSGTLIALVIGYPIVRLITRLIERRADRSLVSGTEVSAQLRHLQDSVDTMAIELERVSEAQRFSAKLLAERSEQH